MSKDVIIPVLEARDLIKRFHPSPDSYKALADVSIAFHAGKRVGIVGESGSGKSTLIRILVGLERPTEGQVLFRGQDIFGFSRAQMLDFRRAVQLVAQDTSSSFDPRHTLRQSIRTPAQTLCGLDFKAADQRVDEVLTGLGIPLPLADRKPADVSGGQRQRISLARALIVGPQLLICDEVVSALDVSVQASVLNLMRDICDQTGSGLVFVSHGLPATAFISETILVMSRGQIVDEGDTRHVLFGSRQPYTTSLREAHDLAPRQANISSHQTELRS